MRAFSTSGFVLPIVQEMVFQDGAELDGRLLPHGGADPSQSGSDCHKDRSGLLKLHRTWPTCLLFSPLFLSWPQPPTPLYHTPTSTLPLSSQLVQEIGPVCAWSAPTQPNLQASMSGEWNAQSTMPPFSFFYTCLLQELGVPWITAGAIQRPLELLQGGCSKRSISHSVNPPCCFPGLRSSCGTYGVACSPQSVWCKSLFVYKRMGRGKRSKSMMQEAPMFQLGGEPLGLH